MLYSQTSNQFPRLVRSIKEAFQLYNILENVLHAVSHIQQGTTPERRNENVNVNKYFFPSSGDLTHNQSILQSHYLPLRHDWDIKIGNIVE